MVAEPADRLVFVGLGNPGKKYDKTRHNLGFLVIEEFARSVGWTLEEEKRFIAKVAKGRLEDREIHLLLPQTFMNESGWSVRQYLDYYKLPLRHTIVVFDDAALEFGQMRLRPRGSAGGHNGIKSLIAHMGTEEFRRLKMGIGVGTAGEPLADYVLSSFTGEEAKHLNAFVERGAAVLKMIMTESIAQVMNRVNTKLTL